MTCCRDHFLSITGVDGRTRRIPFAEDPGTGDMVASLDSRILFGEIGPDQITATNEPRPGSTLAAVREGPGSGLSFVWVPA